MLPFRRAASSKAVTCPMRAQSGIFSFPVRRGSTVTAGGLHPAAPREAPAHFLVKGLVGKHGEKPWQEDDSPLHLFGAACPCTVPSALSPGRRRGESPCPCWWGCRHPGDPWDLLSHVPCPQAVCCHQFSHASALSCCSAMLLSCLLSLPCKSRGRVRARPAPLSSLFCAEGLLAQAGTCVSSASDAVSLPGDVRGSFELISRKAAGFCGRWQQEYLSEVTALPGRRGAPPWARTRFADGRVKPPVTEAQPNPGRAVQDRCGGRAARAGSLSLPGLREPLPVSSTAPCSGFRQGLGDLFKSQGWSSALSHQCCLAHPIRDTVALIKPKQSLN